MGLFSKIKPVKIRSVDDATKFGVAAKDLKDLLKIGCKTLKLQSDDVQACLYYDGTIVTDKYFKTLPDNTELVLVCPGQTWSGVERDIDFILRTATNHVEGLVTAARRLQADEQRRRILNDYLLTLKDDTSEKEHRKDDEEWFQDLNPRFKTKSDFMKSNCESRIRGYTKELDAAAANIRKKKDKDKFEKASEFLKEKLKKAKYNSCYFDRTAEQPDRLCTAAGWFTCLGAFDQDACSSFHSINPYSSRDARIVFSTWNLDHRIEKKRTIIPALVESLQNQNQNRVVDLDYFYRLLFTTDNLKLVHIVCHKKTAHDLECDAAKIYIKKAPPTKRPPPGLCDVDPSFNSKKPQMKR